MLHSEDMKKAVTWAFMKKAVTWAFLTARQWGWSASRENGMIWVNTGSNEIGCDGDYDFVSFMSDENRTRAQRG